MKKATGKIRLCIDYRRLNKITINDPFQMPCIEDLLNKGFYQVPLGRASQEKTAFCTPWGRYAFTRMPFGLKNAPAAFQRCMENTLDHLRDSCSVYIDDILIFSATWEEHVQHIEEVLEALVRAGLTANPDKCVCTVTRVFRTRNWTWPCKCARSQGQGTKGPP